MELVLALDYTAILSQKEGGKEEWREEKRKGGTCKNSLMLMFGWTRAGPGSEDQQHECPAGHLNAS